MLYDWFSKAFVKIAVIDVVQLSSASNPAETRDGFSSLRQGIELLTARSVCSGMHVCMYVLDCRLAGFNYF